jgi:hypothetical protein
MLSSSSRRLVAILSACLVAVMIVATGCSDDPILGPDDGSSDYGGGSYGVIKRLAPEDTTDTPVNPKQF